jgi:hypothetical protein
MVADDFIYSDEAFGLSDLISILNKPPGPYVRFELACAHRSPNVSDAQAVVDEEPPMDLALGRAVIALREAFQMAMSVTQRKLRTVLWTCSTRAQFEDCGPPAGRRRKHGTTDGVRVSL